MKELYKSFSIWHFGQLPRFLIGLWMCFIAWKSVQDASSENALKAAWFYLSILFLYFSAPQLDRRLFDIRAFDDGDALVLKRRTVSERVLLSHVERVEYVTGFGKPQRIRLHLTQPCVFGQIVTFPVSNEIPAPRHNEIADDLHRRSRRAE